MDSNDYRLVDFEKNQLLTDDLVEAILDGNHLLVNKIMSKSLYHIRQDKLEEANDRHDNSFNRGYRKGLYDLAKEIQIEMDNAARMESSMRAAFKTKYAQAILDYLFGIVSSSRADIMEDFGIDKITVTNAALVLQQYGLIDIKTQYSDGTKYSIAPEAYNFMKTQRYKDMKDSILKTNNINKAINALKSALLE